MNFIFVRFDDRFVGGLDRDLLAAKNRATGGRASSAIRDIPWRAPWLTSGLCAICGFCNSIALSTPLANCGSVINARHCCAPVEISGTADIATSRARRRAANARGRRRSGRRRKVRRAAARRAFLPRRIPRNLRNVRFQASPGPTTICAGEIRFSSRPNKCRATSRSASFARHENHRSTSRAKSAGSASAASRPARDKEVFWRTRFIYAREKLLLRASASAEFARSGSPPSGAIAAGVDRSWSWPARPVLQSPECSFCSRSSRRVLRRGQ